MERQVVIGVHPGIIGEHVVHLVEAVRRGEILHLVADMPFAKLHRGVVRLLQKLGDGRCLFGETVGVAWCQHGGKRRADRDAAGDEGGAAGGAARLAIIIDEAHAFGGETIEVRCRRAAHNAAAIAAEIAPADVVGHDDHDIGGLSVCADAAVAVAARAHARRPKTKRSRAFIGNLLNSIGSDRRRD